MIFIILNVICNYKFELLFCGNYLIYYYGLNKLLKFLKMCKLLDSYMNMRKVILII